MAIDKNSNLFIAAGVIETLAALSRKLDDSDVSIVHVREVMEDDVAWASVVEAFKVIEDRRLALYDGLAYVCEDVGRELLVPVLERMFHDPEIIEQLASRDEFVRLLDCLRLKWQAAAVVMHFGLDGSEVSSSSEIAEEIGLGSSTVSVFLNGGLKTAMTRAHRVLQHRNRATALRADENPLARLNLTVTTSGMLSRAGVTTPEQLAGYTIDGLRELLGGGLGPKRVAELVSGLKALGLSFQSR